MPFAHTPAFVGSHITGYDNVMKGILEHFWDGKAGTAPKLEREPNETINFIGGFDGYTVGNMREIKRIFEPMGVEYTILGDNSDVWDTPTDGEFRMYDGGTTLEEAANAVHAKATISMQEYCTEKTLPLIQDQGQEVVAFNHPIGVAATDEFLMEVCRASPARRSRRRWRRERGRLVDAIAELERAYPRQEIRDLRRSGPLLRPRGIPARTGRRADARPRHQRQQGLGRRRCRRCSTARPSARTARSIPARISGTCARCCSPSRSTS